MSYQLNGNPVTAPPPPHPPAQTLAGQFITLEPLPDTAALFVALYAASHGTAERETIWDYLPYGPFAAADEMQAAYRQMAAGGDPQFYYVRDNDSGEPCGIVSYLRIEPAAYSIEIGHIWHAVPHQRGRSNTEAVFLLLNNAFTLGYRRLEWKCNALNQRSRRAALRLGFAFEGIFRQHTVFKQKNRDTAWFAMLDTDWQIAAANFRQWLTAAPGECSLNTLNLPLVQWSLPAHDAYC